MAFVVCHMEKYTSGNLGGLQRHNQRETENHANKDIHPELSYLNYDLVNAGEISYPEKIKARIAEGVETNRAIRKDAVRVCSFIISASPELFDRPEMKEHAAYLDEGTKAFPVPANGTRDYFQAATDFFKARYGPDNVAYAQVHMDETTPHMHLGVVPITSDHRLSAKRLFDRQELKKLQAELPEYLQRRGFAVQKGQSKDRHLDEFEYKRLQAEKRARQAQEKAARAEQEARDMEWVLSEQAEELKDAQRTTNEWTRKAAQAKKTLVEKTRVLTRRTAEEIKLNAHQAELEQSARALAGKLGESTETLGHLQTAIDRERRNLEGIKAAADQVRLDSYAIDQIPAEIKRTGILRNGPETITVTRRDWESIKVKAKSSLAFREQSERFERENKELGQRNAYLGNELREARRENRQLKSLLEKKDQLIGHLKQAMEELYKDGEAVFHQLVGYVKGRFMMRQKPAPEEEGGFEQGAARTQRELEDAQKAFEQKQSRGQEKDWEIEP